MPRIHVCSLFRVTDVAQATGAKSLVTLIDGGTAVTTQFSTRTYTPYADGTGWRAS